MHRGWLCSGRLRSNMATGWSWRRRPRSGAPAASSGQADLTNLLLDDHFRAQLLERQGAWRAAVAAAVELGIPAPALSASLAYFDGYRQERSPANLIQAQRDDFGAHT